MESWSQSLKQNKKCRKWLQVPPETVTSCKPQTFHVQLMFCFFRKDVSYFETLSVKVENLRNLCKTMYSFNLLALHPARKSEKTHVGIKQHLKLPPRWATCQRRRAVWWPDVAGFIGPSGPSPQPVICRYNAFIKGYFQGWTGEVQGWEGHI